MKKNEAMYKAYGTSNNACCTCCWLYRDNHRGKHKCRIYGNDGTAATDWKPSWLACGLHNQPLSPGFVTLIKQISEERNKEAEPEQLDGQISMEELLSGSM